jgi:hypothetical protein
MDDVGLHITCYNGRIGCDLNITSFSIFINKSLRGKKRQDRFNLTLSAIILYTFIYSLVCPATFAYLAHHKEKGDQVVDFNNTGLALRIHPSI